MPGAPGNLGVTPMTSFIYEFLRSKNGFLLSGIQIKNVSCYFPQFRDENHTQFLRIEWRIAAKLKYKPVRNLHSSRLSRR